MSEAEKLSINSSKTHIETFTQIRKLESIGTLKFQDINMQLVGTRFNIKNK